MNPDWCAICNPKALKQKEGMGNTNFDFRKRQEDYRKWSDRLKTIEEMHVGRFELDLTDNAYKHIYSDNNPNVTVDEIIKNVEEGYNMPDWNDQGWKPYGDDTVL
jgi:hypothetical protein